MLREYIEGLFDVWSHAKEEIHIPIILETLHCQLGYFPNTCWMKGTCQSFIGFEPDGVVSPCCEMSLAPSFHFGNICSQSLKEILESPGAQRFWTDRSEGDQNHCSGCEWTHLW
jgi:radical SAM protein with 4Fe4S-binding SPASM domain